MKRFHIYFPHESRGVFLYHLRQLTNRWSDSWTIYNDSEAFINACQADTDANSAKIACFQIPFPYDVEIEKQIDEVYEYADRVLVLGPELHQRTVDFIQRFDREKMTWFVCGFLQGGTISKSKSSKFLDWFVTSLHFYKNIKPSILYDLNPYEEEPLLFDALMGRKKPHRDLAYHFINDNGLADKGIVSYINSYKSNFDASDSSKWQWESKGIENFEESSKSINYTVDHVNYYGQSMSISQILPIDIYNQTAYSLVCETNDGNGHVFFTEKTVKPILARRMFITLGNRFHLLGLHRLGFKTFNGIIDESYDSILDPTDRHLEALEQFKWLCEQDQRDILPRIREIVDYNYDLLYSNDWYNWFRIEFGDYFFEHKYSLRFLVD